MKFLLTIFTFLFITVSTAGEIPYDELAKSFSAQNAEQIINLGKDKIAITLNGKDGVYSHQQGRLVLSNFFKAHPPLNFKFIFKGKKHGNSSFAIGSYKSEKSNFRITIQFKINASNEYRIERITIDPE